MVKAGAIARYEVTQRTVVVYLTALRPTTGLTLVRDAGDDAGERPGGRPDGVRVLQPATKGPLPGGEHPG